MDQAVSSVEASTKLLGLFGQKAEVEISPQFYCQIV
jgi:hypothetical protein